MLVLFAGVAFSQGVELRQDGYHVHPGQSIQMALEAAATNASQKQVWVHAGIYRPQRPHQALLWFHRKHDGVQVRARGQVILSAANPELSNPGQMGHPALLNHVVYFGDGISPRTLLEGFRVTGANGFVTTNHSSEVEPNSNLDKGLFFFCDGGGVKIFGRSFPTLRGLEIVDNYASPCAGGISVEHNGLKAEDADGFVRIENCIFRNNRAQITGAAVDLLPGSSAILSNCLFVGNLPNTGRNFIDPNQTRPAFTNSAPVTVFPGSRVHLIRCTFTRNRNALDYFGSEAVLQDCIFWRNEQPGGHYTMHRYEVDLQGRDSLVKGCFFGGKVQDPHGQVSQQFNTLEAPDPRFDPWFIPTAPAYEKAGYRSPAHGSILPGTPDPPSPPRRSPEGP